MTGAAQETLKRKKPSKEARRWAPRLWLGASFPAWMRLLAQGRFRVGWKYSYIAAADTFASVMNSTLAGVQAAVYRRTMREVELKHDPLFIIGHWRSGTTLLHEMMILDPRHTYPTTYECFSPNHFLLTGDSFPRWFHWVMPDRRPMDNMAAGWDRPQEDEFALCNLGLPSPYLTIAFPNEGPKYEDYLDLENISSEELAAWKEGLHRFLRHVAAKAPEKRIVLKSPPHTCRIRTLLEMYPRAQFVHIVRDPGSVLPSTVNLWKRLYETHGLQKPECDWLEEHVLETFSRMYDKFERDRPLLSESQLCEVRYEDLVENPVEQMRRIYGQLDLGDFDNLLPPLEEYLASVSDYQTNKYTLTDSQRASIEQRWRPFLDRYGYWRESEESNAASSA